MVATLIDRYDYARAATPDKPMIEPPAGYSRPEQISTGYRAALFFVALEDICGHDNLRTALRDIIHDRAGSDTGYEELRAATESVSKKDLAQMFHTWLVQTEIPGDFRTRYQNPKDAQLRR
jgi:aminopeptidase N